MPAQLLSPLNDYVEELLAEADRIPERRKQLLLRLSDYLRTAPVHAKGVNFICTHNSRRSHLAQVWAAVAVAYFQIDGVNTFSGGTQATAFNPRAVAALGRSGFQVSSAEGQNPHYFLTYAEHSPPLECWSKTYDDPANPRQQFAAVMTCSDADENCPFIPGAELRLALTYEDPKVADDTHVEAVRYDERTRQIGREIFFAVKHSTRTR